MPPSNAQEDIEPLINRVGELHRYLLDLKGYLVVKDALSKSEIDGLSHAIDKQLLPPPTTYNRFGTAPLGSGFLDWDPSFMTLVDHTRVINTLQFLLGPSFTLRSIQGIYEERFVGERLHRELHSISKIGEETGLACSVIWNVTDSGPGIGGFCCIEGSHHVRTEPPASINDDLRQSPHVVTPDAPAGSAIISTSRLLQGNASWHGPHQRRSLVFEYSTIREEDPTRRIRLPSCELTRQQIAMLGHSNT